MGKLGNTLAMLRILETGHKYTVNELARKIEVTPRMIKEYKSELEKAGIYIESINGIHGGYIYNGKNSYDIKFNIKDVNTLEKILPKLDETEKASFERILEKIKTIVIYSEEHNENFDNALLEKNYNIISKAIKNGSELSFIYKNKEKRLIPYNLSFYKENIYITGYSPLDDDLRTYNILEINF